MRWFEPNVQYQSHSFHNTQCWHVLKASRWCSQQVFSADSFRSPLGGFIFGSTPQQVKNRESWKPWYMTRQNHGGDNQGMAVIMANLHLDAGSLVGPVAAPLQGRTDLQVQRWEFHYFKPIVSPWEDFTALQHQGHRAVRQKEKTMYCISFSILVWWSMIIFDFLNLIMSKII